MFRMLLLSAALALGAASLLAMPAHADGWKAGAAKRKITPGRLMWMAGYGGRNHPATGLLNDLYAKALVLEDGRGTRVALVTLDLVGISPDLAGPITDELKSKYQLERSHVALCCSHTHSGPAVGFNLRTLHFDQLDAAQKQLVEQYAGELRTAVVGVMGAAIEALAPCEVSFGHGEATFAVNRRNNKEPDAARLRTAGELVGPFDHDVPVLKIAGKSGQLQAVVCGYACHATVLDGYDWSSDYPGFAQSELEAKHPGTIALFVAGCGADQNPLPRRQVELARQYGRDLAAAVDRALGDTFTPLAGNIDAAWSQIPLELAHVPARDEIEKDAQSSDRYVSARARHYLERLGRGEAISPTYPYPVQIWQLGKELTFVTLGGEVVVDYALRIKDMLGAKRTWVAGYSNDVMAYIPSRRVLAEGGYEGGGAMVYYSLPSPWAPTVEDAIINAVRSTASK